MQIKLFYTVRITHITHFCEMIYCPRCLYLVPLLEYAPFLQTGFQETLFASVISSARDKNFKGVTI